MMERDDDMKDPICNMEVDESTPFRLAYNRVTYYFCSGKCLEKFKSALKKM